MHKPMDVKEIIKSFPDKHILVLGDVMLDSYIRGDAERISPEAPVPVVLQKSTHNVLGGAANVANNIASLGGKVTLIGIVGKDSDAAVIRKLCALQGITDGLVVDPSRPTTVKLRVTARRMQLLRIDKESVHGISKKIENAIIACIKAMPVPDLVVVSDYVKGCLTKNIIAALRKRFGGRKIIADIKPTHAGYCKSIFAITPNFKEACEIIGINQHDRLAHPDKLAGALAKKLSASVVLTLGERGITIFDNAKKKIRRIPSRAVTIYDVTGAGDTVVGAMSLALAGGADLYAAADFANHAAGFVISKEGTTAITEKEIPLILRDYENNKTGGR
ncbi:MAG: bifunctional ADP-heptose synthase [Candidatus Liptonbacteria bacterium]